MWDEHAIGEQWPDLDASRLRSSAARRVRVLLSSHRAFSLRGIGQWTSFGVDYDVLSVECANDGVPSRNVVGINVREPLALLFPIRENAVPQVRALRKDFPLVLHLNHVAAGEPASLCVYFEPWSAIERTWTPQRFLGRILWWLRETAQGTLHRPDQPVEQLYFESGFELVLSPDFFSKSANSNLAMLIDVVEREGGQRTFRTCFVSSTEIPRLGNAAMKAVFLSLPSVVHGRIEQQPGTLGALHDQLASRGAVLIESLREAIRSHTPSTGLVRHPAGSCLLILHVPILRSEGAEPEGHQWRGCFVPEDLAYLGEACDVLFLNNGRYYATSLLGVGVSSARWRDFQVVPLDIRPAQTLETARRASGISEEGAEDSRVLAGVGALGSALADIWSREGWGRWTYVDGDHIKGHNIARHAAKDPDIGRYKVDAVAGLTQRNYQDDYYRSQALRVSVLDRDEPKVVEALGHAVLFVDATTTFEVPRDLAQREEFCRSTSVFFTPSGLGAVLLLEDARRAIRLDALEAQYYRAVLDSPWGVHHLRGNQGHLWVGAGCRDVSAVIPTEHVQLLAAVLARQVRLQSARPEACARVWTLDATTSSLAVSDFLPSEPVRRPSGEWTVVSNVAIESKLAELRREHVPRETGGAILGYVDHKLKKIFVVDVLPEPSDSHGSIAGFTRGTHGLLATIETTRARTAGVVGYVGEWHSHPPFCPPAPSVADREQVVYLAEEFAREGEPALMMIVGRDNEVSYTARVEA